MNASHLLKLVREIDLGKIQRESEHHFSLLLWGDAALTRPLAESLSASEGRAGVHPWLTVGAPGDAIDLSPFDLALVVRTQPDADLNADDGRILEQLSGAGVPIVAVVIETSPPVGAELPGQHETERVLLSPTSLSEPKGLQDQLIPELLRAVHPDLRLALAKHLPLVRPVFVRGLVEETARANALYTASTGLAAVVPVLNLPLNVADIVVLTKNQLVMAYKIALAGGKRGRPQEVMGEIVSVLGGGFFFRQVARELVGLVPVWGVVPNIAISYAGTWVIGQTVYLWVSQGERLGRAELRRIYDRALSQGRSLARTLTAGRKSKEHALPPAPEPEAPGETPPREGA